MNDTAKKLREAAEYIGDGETCSDTAIVTVREMFDVGRADTFGGDLGRVLVAIADELDKLQTKANEANNLRQQLESAEDKAERRKKHIGYLNTALHDKNVLFKQRGEALAKVTAENADLRKQVPTEREREILDMWPRYEDGEYVWFGDEVACRGKACMLDDVKFVSDGTFHDATYLYVSNGLDVFEVPIAAGERVKRPARSVLDADGVETKSGDTVYLLKDGDKCRVTGFETIDGEVFARLHCDDRPEIEGARGSAITHRRRVLDADGVEIRAGDTVWFRSLSTGDRMRKATVTGFGERNLDVRLASVEDEAGKTWHIDPKRITHTPPDSWERLEEDVNAIVTGDGLYHRLNNYCNARDLGGDDVMCLTIGDIARRAKALAGVEVE